MLTVQAYRAYGMQVAEGVLNWVQTNRPWDVVFTRHTDHPTSELLETYRPIHGLITQGRWAEDLKGLLTAGLPVVLVEESELPVAQVFADDFEIGRLAAEHLGSLGLETYAYMGVPNAPFSDRRYEAFCRRLGEMLGRVDIRQCPDFRGPGGGVTDDLADWMQGLPKPAGLFAFNSILAIRVLAQLHQHGLAVPEDLAMLGVENDEVTAELSIPPLSTIDHNGRRIGYEAAGMLDRLMRGQELSERVLLVPPKMVVERQSTNVLQTPDADVVRAMRFIRDNVCEEIKVDDVIRVSLVPRRSLERRFRRRLSCGIGEFIIRTRVDRVKELLVETNLPMPDIAVRSGFRSATQMSRSFRKALGTTPTQYRREHSV
jgi:LacI family transcriptional regulator